MCIRDSAWPAGTPCWVDYGAADLDAAKAFYSELFGWDYISHGEGYGGYLIARLRGRDAAGIVTQMDASQQPSWSTYFATDDVEATAARIRDAGGTVVAGPMEVGDRGAMAYAVDPQGNPFGVWRAGLTTGYQVFNEPGSLVWTDGATDDLAAGEAFYRAVFGFSWADVDGMDGQYATFALADGRPLGGLGAASPDGPMGWVSCFAVASTDDTVAAVERHGGRTTTPAQDTEYGRFAVLEDPWGAPFSVMQVAEEA